jgi:hypothetical protein
MLKTISIGRASVFLRRMPSVRNEWSSVSTTVGRRKQSCGSYKGAGGHPMRAAGRAMTSVGRAKLAVDRRARAAGRWNRAVGRRMSAAGRAKLAAGRREGPAGRAMSAGERRIRSVGSYNDRWPSRNGLCRSPGTICRALQRVLPVERSVLSVVGNDLPVAGTVL